MCPSCGRLSLCWLCLNSAGQNCVVFGTIRGVWLRQPKLSHTLQIYFRLPSSTSTTYTHCSVPFGGCEVVRQHRGGWGNFTPGVLGHWLNCGQPLCTLTRPCQGFLGLNLSSMRTHRSVRKVYVGTFSRKVSDLSISVWACVKGGTSQCLIVLVPSKDRGLYQERHPT